MDVKVTEAVMAEHAQQGSQETVRQAASETIKEGVDIRKRVHDLTLAALGRQGFERGAVRDVVRAVTEGVGLGAEASRADMRQALAEAFRGLDDALVKSVQAGNEALKHLVSAGKDFSEHDLRQALAGLKKVEDDFLATVEQVADAASDKVRPELRELVRTATSTGTQTGKQVATTMSEFARRFSAASLEATLAGLQAASEFGARFALAASGVLAGMADALQKPRAEKEQPPKT
jgi:hypothetical protein